MSLKVKQAIFYQEIEPLSPSKHGKMGLVKTLSPYSFANETHAVPVGMNEISAISVNYPVIFTGDNFVPTAVLGLVEESNLFVSESGEWLNNSYVPSFVRRYPFITARIGDVDGEKTLCIDSCCEYFSTESNMISLFENDKPAEFTLKQFVFCEQVEDSLKKSQRVSAILKDLDLFCVKTLSFQSREETEEKLQFTAIDDEKFASLSDKQFLELRDAQALPLVYGHFNSLMNWNRLITLHQMLAPQG